jgi:hypothetical protein
MLIKIQPYATVCRYLFTAKSLYMFRVSQHPSSGVLKTVTGTGHNTRTATSLQRGLIGPHWREVAVPVPVAAVTAVKTVTAASGTGQDIGTATSLQRGLIRREVAIPVL